VAYNSFDCGNAEISMIIDVHTHIFPPEVRADRERYLAAEPTFAKLYTSPRARIATAEDLIRSMDAAAVDVSVALGFAWTGLEACQRHNDYLLEAAATSGGRIVAFCTLPLATGQRAVEAEAQRCAASGARGFGELRPDDLGFDLAGEGGSLLDGLARNLDLPLLFHASEPVGHAYPGKDGLALHGLYDFIEKHPGIQTIAAHWGGGLPFYALMPEVKHALTSASFDTAGTSLLYTHDIYRQVVAIAGVEKILFGSDFPLLSQARSRRRIEESGLDAQALDLIVGNNARRLLSLE
jgi:predicted TIM-barrel fold metal-dependent hydrolase